MSWSDCQRWRARATKVRAAGYLSFALAFIAAVVLGRDLHGDEALAGFVFYLGCGGVVMLLAQAIAWYIDKKAERLAGR